PSTSAARYRSTDGNAETLTAFFEGDHDGNVSNFAFDANSQPGSQPPPAGIDPMGESVTGSGLSHPVGSTIDFELAVDPRNQGVVLRRLLDQGTFGQRAELLVAGTDVGTWLSPGDNA